MTGAQIPNLLSFDKVFGKVHFWVRLVKKVRNHDKTTRKDRELIMSAMRDERANSLRLPNLNRVKREGKIEI